MHLFYAPDIENNPVLPEEESRHAVRVLRLITGDTVLVSTGKGSLYQATIAEVHPKACRLNALVRQVAPQEASYRLHIAIAPTKNMDRLEWFVEKAAEIGIHEISPIFCRYSERKVLKNIRLQKILVSAMKQSMQANLCKLNEPCKFADFIKTASADQKLIAHCHEAEKQLLSHQVQKGKHILLLIGPEGDFSKEEVALATAAGFEPISLGDNRLRVETAALLSCATVSIINSL